MSEPIDRKTAHHVGKLARLELTDEQADASAKHLASILNYVDQLAQVEVPDDVEAFFGATESVNAVREDQVQPSMDRETILKNAPDSDGEFYRVPPVFG
jgi:aspartyl-tRNA(Asn)/glutamyl-tRNA(Gln) amidotransferase subunit C